MNYVLGIDGGGTKTKAILADIEGKIVDVCFSGASNFQRVGPNGLVDVCRDLLNQIEDKTSISKEDISHWALGLAGAGRVGDRQAAKKALEEAGIGGHVSVQSDAYVALLGAFSGNPGVIIISGTGSICFGLDEQGKLYRSGGWGYLLGDEGSGFFIGHQAVLAALKDLDGRGKKTSLKAKVEKRFGLAALEQIVPKMYIENTIRKEEIASLAPVVFECASEGDEVARRIVERTAREMAKMILAVGTQMNKLSQPLSVAYIGSVFKRKETLFPIISKELKPHFGAVKIDKPAFEPAIGAVIWALKNNGIHVTSEIGANLKEYDVAG